MFKNRHLQVRVVKSKTNDENSITKTTSFTITPEQASKLARTQVKTVAIAIGIVIVVAKLLDTVNEVAVIAAESKFK